MGINNIPFNNMSVSQDLIWQLTKRNNANLVKFNGNMWSKAPLNSTGFHNASQSASTISIHGSQGPKAKRFDVVTKRICKNGIKKIAKCSTIRGDNTRQSCSTVHGAARTIKALVYQTHSARRNAYKRLQRVTNTSRANVHGAAVVKKAE